jgi:hypothetical protein
MKEDWSKDTTLRLISIYVVRKPLKRVNVNREECLTAYTDAQQYLGVYREGAGASKGN